MYGLMGKILYIDLTDKKIDRIEVEPYGKKYVGGRGIATKIYFDEVKPDISAYDPENRLIFMTGVLVGTGVQGANRMVIAGKSAFTNPETFCYGNFGGFFPAELKKAGYDGIVIKGASPSPVYLFIEDESVKILDAEFLWGKNAYEVERLLKKIHGEDVCYLTYGIAGENLVRSATITGSHRASASGGLAAVMGSKRLKAIAVKGRKRPKVANPQLLKELNRYTFRLEKRLRLSIPPKVMGTGKGDLLKVVGKSKCYKCGLECVAGIILYGGRLKGLRKCQAMEFYLPWLYSKDDEPIETFFDAPTLANDYSIDTFELESIIEWLFACHKEGVIKEKDCNLPLSEIGRRQFLERLLNMMAKREGFGDLLAQGLSRASKELSEDALQILRRTGAVPISDHVYILEREVSEARSHVVNMLLYQMEPRRHRPILHHGFALAAWHMHQIDPELSPVSTKLLEKIAKDFWGSEDAAYGFTYEGKALSAKKEQNRTYIEDSLGLCDWAYPLTYSFATEDHSGDPNLEAKLFSATAGLSLDSAVEELERCGERIANLQRLILFREGFKIPESDIPPEFHFLEPLIPDFFHKNLYVPDRKAGRVDVKGRVLEKEGYLRMVKEYYRLRGWDELSGLPKEETLSMLDL